MNPGRAQKLKGEPEPVIPKDDDAEEEEEEEEAPPPPEETEAAPSGPKLEVDYAVGSDMPTQTATRPSTTHTS
jgi:hypothetical protein